MQIKHMCAIYIQYRAMVKAMCLTRLRKRCYLLIFFLFVSSLNTLPDWLSQMRVANQPPPAMEEGINARWLLI